MSGHVGGRPGLIRTKLTPASDALLSSLAGKNSIQRLARELGTTPVGLSRLIDGGTATPAFVMRVEEALARYRRAS